MIKIDVTLPIKYKRDDLIDASQKFRRKMASQAGLPPLRLLLRMKAQAVGSYLAPGVGGHDDHRIVEAHPPTGGIRQAAFLHDLQEKTP